ncbi:hypothetical protein [Mesorhizobium sp. DCY119]|uniref:hypothetical protein n=1 Tax=Mesorhizobium sp. DCY119 TaxID=2108445 RepID=UPI000E6CF6FB|nr:hypothetical protein [Mesorhizobium sp. DCY119]RJG46645.1 hypothetical protein D3Y55_21910 [Mesorhizobium sp. DCY119]
MTHLVHQRAINALLTDAVETADRAKSRVTHTANTLARQMQEMHGGIWRVEIDHQAGFVLVAPRIETAIKPS